MTPLSYNHRPSKAFEAIPRGSVGSLSRQPIRRQVVDYKNPSPGVPVAYENVRPNRVQAQAGIEERMQKR